MVASSFDGRVERGSHDAAGVPKNLIEEATRLYGTQAGTESLVACRASFVGKNIASKTGLLEVEGAMCKSSLSKHTVSANSLETPADNGTAAFSCATQAETVSWTADPTSQGEDPETAMQESRSKSATDNFLSKKRDASDLLVSHSSCQHVVVDIQLLQALHERLLQSEERLWLTQRQLLDEQGKEAHLKNQILYLEDEVERARAEGLVTACRYVEQAEYLEASRNKLSRLTEENETLETCLSEEISEGRALQELAEQLIFRLGNKTDALLEEGVRVTRVLAFAWNKEDLLAELEKNDLLQLQLARVALLFCNNETREEHNDTTSRRSFPARPGTTALTHSDEASLKLRPELFPCVGSEPLTECTLSLPGLSDTLAKGSLFDGQKAFLSGDGLPAFLPTASGSTPSKVHTTGGSEFASAGETVYPNGSSGSFRSRLPGTSPSTPAKTSVVSSSSPHRPPEGNELVETGRYLCTSGDGNTSLTAIRSQLAFGEAQDNTPPSSPEQIASYMPDKLNIVHRESDVARASTADKSSVRLSGDSEEFEEGIIFSEESKNPLVDAGNSCSSLKKQDGICEADLSSYNTPLTGIFPEGYAAARPGVVSTSTGVNARRSTLDDGRTSVVEEKQLNSMSAFRVTETQKTEGISESVSRSPPDADVSNRHAGSEGMPATTRSAPLQRARSEAWRLGSVGKHTSRGLVVDQPTQGVIEADILRTRRKTTAIAARRKGVVEKATTHAPQGTANSESSSQSDHQINTQFTYIAGESHKRFSNKACRSAPRKGTARYGRSRSPTRFSIESKAGIHKQVYSNEKYGSPVLAVDVSEVMQDEKNSRKIYRSSSSCNTKHISSPQASSSAPLDSRIMPYRSNQLAAGETATSLKRDVVLSRASALAGTEKKALSSRAPHATGVKKQCAIPQTTSRATASRVLPLFRGASATALRTAVSSLPPLNVSQRRQKEQRQQQHTSRNCRGPSSKTQPSPAKTKSSGGAISEIETEAKSAEIAATAYKATTAMTVLCGGGAMPNEKILSTSEQDTKKVCAGLLLSDLAPLPPGNSQSTALADVTMPTSGTFDEDGQIQNNNGNMYPQQDACPGGAAQHKSHEVEPSNATCDAEHIESFHVPLSFPSALLEKPSQTLQQQKTKLTTEKSEAHYMMSSSDLSIPSDQAFCVRKVPTEVRESNTDSNPVECNVERALSVEAVSGAFSQEKQISERLCGPAEKHIIEQQRDLHDLPSADPIGFFRAKNIVKTIPAPRKSATSHLSPLPPVHQSKLATCEQPSVVTTESLGISSFAFPPLVSSPAFRRSAEGNISPRELRAAGVAHPGAASNISSVSADPSWRNTHPESSESGQWPNTSIWCLDTANKDTLDTKEPLSRHIVGEDICSGSEPSGCASRDSNDVATEERAFSATSSTLDRSFLQVNQGSQAHISQRSQSSTKRETGRLCTAGTNQHRKTDEEDKACTPLAGKDCQNSLLAQIRLAKDRVSHNVADDGNRLEKTESPPSDGRREARYRLDAASPLQHAQGTLCIGKKLEDHRQDISALSLTCKSALPNKDNARKTVSRRTSALNFGTRSSKVITKAPESPKHKESRKVQVSSRRRSCATVRHSSVSLERTSALAQKAASKTKKKTDEVAPDMDTDLFCECHAESSGYIAPATNRRSHNPRNSITSSRRFINRIHTESSNTDGLVYHDMPTTGRRLLQPTATPSCVGDNHRDTHYNTRSTEECSLSEKIKSFTSLDCHEVNARGFTLAHSSWEDSPSRLSSLDKHTRNHASEGLSQREKQLEDNSNELPSFSSSSVSAQMSISGEQQRSDVIGARETDKTCVFPLTIEQDVSLLTSSNGSTFDKAEDSKTDLHSSTKAASGRSSQPILREVLPPKSPRLSPSACLILSPPDLNSCPQSNVHQTPSNIVGNVDMHSTEEFSVESGQRINGEQKQYQQQDMSNYVMTGGPQPRVASWASSDSATNAYSNSPPQCPSLKMSVPVRNGSTCAPALNKHMPSSGDATVVEKVLVQGTPELKEEEEGSKHCRESVGRRMSLATSSQNSVLTESAPHTGSPGVSRQSSQPVPTQLRSDAVPAATSKNLSLNNIANCFAGGAQKEEPLPHVPPAFRPLPDTRTSEGGRHQATRAVPSPISSSSDTEAQRIQGLFGQQQLPTATATHQRAFYRTHSAIPPAELMYGSGPPLVAFPLCTRSSVPLQQQCKYRTSQTQEQQQRRLSAMKPGEQQQLVGHWNTIVRSQQQQQPSRCPVLDWGSCLRPQQWHPLQAQQFQRSEAVAGQSLQQKEKQHLSNQNLQTGSWQCHQEQLPCLTQQQPQHQQQQQGSKELISQSMAHQGQQQRSQVQVELQQRQEQASKPMEKQANCGISPLFLRQTLPMRGAEKGLGLSELNRQQQTQLPMPQQQEIVRDHRKQMPIVPPINRKQMQAEVADPLLKWPHSGATAKLEQQRQKQNRGDAPTCIKQQRRSTTDYSQARIGVDNGYGKQHLLNKQIPPVRPQIVQQTQVQVPHGTALPTQQQQQHQLHTHSQQLRGDPQLSQVGFQLQQQPQANAQQQQQQSQPDSQQRTPIQLNSEQLNSYTQKTTCWQLQPPQQRLPTSGTQWTQVQQRSVQHAMPPQQGKRKSTPQAPQVHSVRCAGESEIQEQDPLKQSAPLQQGIPAQQQQPQPQAMSPRWSRSVLSGCRDTQELQKAFIIQHQRHPQLPREWQHQVQQELPQQGKQQQLHSLRPQVQQLRDVQLQQQRQQMDTSQLQKPQQQMGTSQVQQQQMQQQLLQQYFWNVVQMHQRRTLSACKEKDCSTSTLYRTSDRPAVINCGTHIVKKGPLIPDSRATISAGFNKKEMSFPPTIFHLPFCRTEATPCTNLPVSAAGKNFILSKPCIPAPSSLPPGLPTVQASRVTAPVFPPPAAAATTRRGFWRGW